MQVARLCTILLASFFSSATASAQVFDVGPSDSALFTNVINLPGDVLPDPDPGPIDGIITIGGVAGETTQLNIAAGGSIPTTVFNLDAGAGAEINISGGTVLKTESLFALEGSEINITGGQVGDFAQTLGGQVNISGGIVGNNFVAGFFFAPFSIDSEVNISGGIVGDRFTADTGSVVNISGGSVGEEFFAEEGSQINVSGGSVGERFFAAPRSNVNLFGRDFALDGVLLADVIEGETFTIFDRDVTLSGLLDDGSAFSFDLNSESDFRRDFFSSDATLTVTIGVPEPTSMAILLLGCGLAFMRRVRLAA